MNEEIVKEHLPLVKKIVRGFYVPYGLEKDDLIQAGMIGIWKALQKYESGKGSEFVTYAYVSARNEILQLLRKHKKFKHEIRGINEHILATDYELEEYMEQVFIKEDLERDEKYIVNLLYEGYTQREIAKILDTTQPRVCQRIRQLRIKGKRKWGDADA